MNALTARNDDDETAEQWWSVWRAAHARTCRARKSLFVTPLQVLDYTKANANTSNSDGNASLIYWSLPERKDVTAFPYNNNNSRTAAAAGDDDDNRQTMVDSFVKNWKGTGHTDGSKHNHLSTPPKQNPSSSPKTPSASHSGGGLFSYMTNTVTATLKALTPGRSTRPHPSTMVMSEEQDDALRAWDDEDDAGAQEEEDDAGLAAAAAANTTTAFDHSNHTAIGWDLPVLNVELTEACLDLLEQALASQSHDGIFPTILPRRRTTNRTTAAASSSSSHGEERSADCWKDWIKSVCRSKQGIANDSTTMEKELLSRLSDSEADFLLDCLSRTGSITVIPANEAAGMSKQDLVVLAPPLVPKDGTTATNITMSHQVMASWYELTSAQTSLERRRQQWSEEADNWAQRALQEKAKAKAQNREKGSAGLVSFKIHKLFVKRLEQSEGLLLNLEQSRQALEESWHQREVVHALETSTKALQVLRQESQHDNIEGLMEAHRDEMDHVHDTQQSLSTVSNMLAQDYDETNLLQELESLTLDDDNKESSSLSPSIQTTQTLDASVTSAENVALPTGRNPPKAVPPSAGSPKSKKKVLVPG